ncbi:pyridoxamine 5'-phosphate oxidase [Nitzschia inconspicua]|uniref:Pyridoxamine 5'-phosphate oxidase n=1 Tax=Nitzschia inconspicua TaxID=303405 RepID=A0A9K3K6N2_9STRA|nr:pyridoxamine 5'-phosphate oxidase [Nitzschia inconspicua]KAG7348262.1 pyridoxamine 5'-phosphate oxidase [Nitzschia inconspicua]
MSSSISATATAISSSHRRRPVAFVAGWIIVVLTLGALTQQAQSFTTVSVKNQYTKKHVGATAVAVNGEETKAPVANGDDDTEEDYLWELRLNVFEKAKTVASVCTSGTLCTVSSHDGIQGAPFGSFVDYVLDDEGNPVLLMNEMSMHTINIEQNALNKDSAEATCSNLVTLFTQLSDTAGSSAPQGQDVSRCSFTCRVEKIPRDAPDMDTIRMRYSLTHTYADQVMDSPKFAFYRLLPEKIYYVGGFGVMAKWVDVDDYKVAAPDILAKDASSIVKKLNREFKSDLEGMARHLLNVEKLEDIRVTNVDRLGMDVRVTRQQGTRRNKLSTDEFRVGFRIPVISVEDAKSEILKVFQEAWEKGNGFDWGDSEEPGSTVPIMKIAADSLE